MGMLIALEGVDGAGKRTLAARLADSWRGRGLRVESAAFPRYGESVHADLGAEALRGGHGDLVDSVYGMALMWALDRRGYRDRLRSSIERNDIVLLDRYVASNVAYGAARLRQDPAPRGAFAQWVRETEFGRFGLPVPDAQLLLDVPVALARARAADRGVRDAARGRDAYERDEGLQARVARAYAELAADGWASPWQVVRPDGPAAGASAGGGASADDGAGAGTQGDVPAGAVSVSDVAESIAEAAG